MVREEIKEDEDQQVEVEDGEGVHHQRAFFFFFFFLGDQETK